MNSLSKFNFWLSCRNLHTTSMQSKRKRSPVNLSEEVIDERAIIHKQYNTSRNKLMIEDTKWIDKSITRQLNALATLRKYWPHLYESAIQPSNEFLPLNYQGPALTPPLKNYVSPDGEYEDTTTDWTLLEQKRLEEEAKKQKKKAQ